MHIIQRRPSVVKQRRSWWAKSRDAASLAPTRGNYEILTNPTRKDWVSKYPQSWWFTAWAVMKSMSYVSLENRDRSAYYTAPKFVNFSVFDSGKASPRLARKNRANRIENSLLATAVLWSHGPRMENFMAYKARACWTWSATIFFHYQLMPSLSLYGFCIKWCANIQRRIRH